MRFFCVFRFSTRGGRADARLFRFLSRGQNWITKSKPVRAVCILLNVTQQHIFCSPSDFPTASTSSPTATCLCPDSLSAFPFSSEISPATYSDGSKGNVFINSNQLGEDPYGFTRFENINQFVVRSGRTVKVVGTLIIKAKTITIKGTLDGTGGGYPGSVLQPNRDGNNRGDVVRRFTDGGNGTEPTCDLDFTGACREDSDDPENIDGKGRGGRADFQGKICNVGGGGGAGHGRLALFSFEMLTFDVFTHTNPSRPRRVLLLYVLIFHLPRLPASSLLAQSFRIRTRTESKTRTSLDWPT